MKKFFEKIKDLFLWGITIFFLIYTLFFLNKTYPYFKWGALTLILSFLIWVIWINHISHEEGKLYNVVKFLFPVILFEMLESISLSALYKFREVNFENLKFTNGTVYYEDKIYTGKSSFDCCKNNIYSINIDFFKTVWGTGITFFSEDKDEYDNFIIGKIEFKIFQGKITSRRTYSSGDNQLCKTIKFSNDCTNWQEIFYMNKKIVVKKYEFIENGKIFNYKSEYNVESGITKEFINDKIIKK